MILRSLIAGALLVSMSGISFANTTFPVWLQGEAPGAATSSAKPEVVERSKDPAMRDRVATGIRAPEITVYAPEKPNGMGILVTPGGAYQRVVLDKEGSDLAPYFNAQGYTLFVMTYRMPGESHKEGADAPLADAQRALRTLRAQAANWKLNPQRIGVMGFSAGGHVAASLGTQFDRAVTPAQDDIDRLSAHPDFMVLMYPVISMRDDIGHTGSRKQLLGQHPDEAGIVRYSPDHHVTAQTLPTFLVHAVDDPSVSVENSMVMFSALKAKHIPVEMHLFEKGKHGFGIRGTTGLPVAVWPQLVNAWLSALPVDSASSKK
ncbi:MULTISPECIES: pectin acetylesterase PaeX [Symbiopectobacterium]|uniref:pectin acetylesterase PaeX n=1 Tax=Symbiopectobacterium TaxID=801 RepID=UPI001A1FB04F|nr:MULTISPECIES: pectin acetylesterase PaeX [Symbiopectobacterium]MBG6247880.1 alpha/beta hydrolase [Candidatus Symbiopectobacterium sp. PLON1]MBT9428478.1 alpha/beta hydrolase [Candidatus Symbiopectobacterium endolongispinus]